MADKRQQSDEPRFKTDHEAMEAVRKLTGARTNDEAVEALEEGTKPGDSLRQ